MAKEPRKLSGIFKPRRFEIQGMFPFTVERFNPILSEIAREDALTESDDDLSNRIIDSVVTFEGVDNPFSYSRSLNTDNRNAVIESIIDSYSWALKANEDVKSEDGVSIFLGKGKDYTQREVDESPVRYLLRSWKNHLDRKNLFDKKKFINSLDSIGISKTLREVIENQYSAAEKLSDQINLFKESEADRFRYNARTYDNRNLIPENPILKTNKILSDVAKDMAAVVSLAARTAELNHALNETTSVILAEFQDGAKSSEAASRNAWRLGLAAIFVTLVVAVFDKFVPDFQFADTVTSYNGSPPPREPAAVSPQTKILDEQGGSSIVSRQLNSPLNVKVDAKKPIASRTTATGEEEAATTALQPSPQVK